MSKPSGLEEYTKITSEVLIDRYTKLLLVSREILIKSESPENLKKFDDVRKGSIGRNDKIILSDENIAELISLIKKSIELNGIKGIDGSFGGWVESQISSYTYKDRNVRDYAKLEDNINPMGISEMLSDFNYAKTSSGQEETWKHWGNCTKLWTRGNMFGPYVFKIELDGDRVIIEQPYREENFTRNLVFLDEQQIEKIKNSPFNLLVKGKIMPIQEYNGLIVAIHEYNQLNEDELAYYVNASKMVAEYWTKSLNKSSQQFGEDDETEFYFNVFRTLASKDGINIEPEKLNQFNLLLQQKILKELIEEGECELSVDYHPCGILDYSAKKAGIDPIFPIKTRTVISEEEVIVNRECVLTRNKHEKER